MINEVLSAMGAVAGIGGLSLGVVLIIFKDVIRKNIFPQLTKEQAYKTINRIVSLTSLIAIVGISAWATVKIKVPDGRPTSSVNIIENLEFVDLGQSRRYIESILGIPVVEAKGNFQACDITNSQDTYLRWGDEKTDDPAIQMIFDAEDKLIILVVHVQKNARYKPKGLSWSSNENLAKFELGSSSIFDLTQKEYIENWPGHTNGDARYFSIIESYSVGHSGYHRYYKYNFSYSFGDSLVPSDSDVQEQKNRREIIPKIVAISQVELDLTCSGEHEMEFRPVNYLISVPTVWFEAVGLNI